LPRLDLILARNLGLSRSAVTRLLRAGRVREPDGNRLDDGRLQLPPATLPRTVLVDGAPQILSCRAELLLHKPVGVVTALRDDRHRTAFELVADAPLPRELRAVGRLDLDTSGLLLWTTDGTLLHRLTHPRYAIPRSYHAALSGPFSPPPPELQLDDGHRPDIVALSVEPATAMHPSLVPAADARCHASITITSGRFHEVRRIFAALGSHVLSLCRVQFGPIGLPHDLAAGRWIPIDLRAHFRGIAPREPGGDDDDDDAIDEPGGAPSGS
jgi:16S rRNA pseudouridine516 synthase